MGEKSDLAKEKILREFYRLLCEQGFHKMTLRQLGEACGMSKGHIHFYFKVKEDLIIAISKRFFSETYSMIEELRDAPNGGIFRFSLHKLFLFFLMSKREGTYRIVSEMCGCLPLLTQRVETIYNYACIAFEKEGMMVNKEELKDACICAVHGTFAVVHRDYYSNVPVDYEKVFSIFMKSFFVQIDYPHANQVIEETLQFFNTVNQTALFEQFENRYRYE